MPASTKRSELKRLAKAKSQDAMLLLLHGRYGNAFYLAGYAIELALKACISKQFSSQAIPDRGFVESIYSHNLKKLVGLAGLSQELQDEQKRCAEFATHWGVAGEWNEASRYTSTDAYTAQLMVEAVNDQDTGILRWIQKHW